MPHTTPQRQTPFIFLSTLPHVHSILPVAPCDSMNKKDVVLASLFRAYFNTSPLLSPFSEWCLRCAGLFHCEGDALHNTVGQQIITALTMATFPILIMVPNYPLHISNDGVTFR